MRLCQVPRNEEVQEGGGSTIGLPVLQGTGRNLIFQSSLHQARSVALGKGEINEKEKKGKGEKLR